MITNIICRRSDSPMTSDKPHYENLLPEGWTITTLGEIFQHNNGKQKSSSNKEGRLLKYITTSNVYWGEFDLSNVKEMFFTNNELEKCTVTKGDLLVCEGGDVGRSAIWNYEYPICIQNHLHRLRSWLPVCTEYFFYSLMYNKFKNLIKGKGIGLMSLSSNDLHNIPINLPPVNEQKRIVAEINRWFDLFKSIENNTDNLNTLIKTTKSKVLDLAIHGKLVPQDPTDEPATELLKRINPNAEITSDNGHYQKLPEGWCECTLGSLFLFIRNGINIHQDKSKIGYPITRIETISSEFIDRSRMGYAAITEDNYSDYYLQKDDILMSHINSPIHVGKCALCDIKAGEKIIHGMNLLCLRPYPDIEAKFILMVFRSPYFKDEIRPFIKNAVNQASINIRNLSSVLLHLPPVSEQHRIVAKIEEIFAQLDAIEASLLPT